MSGLTRRERDALVVCGTALLTIFAAGFLTGLAGFETVSASEYRIAAVVLVLVSGTYLGYRGLRRAGRRAVAEWRAWRAA